MHPLFIREIVFLEWIPCLHETPEPKEMNGPRMWILLFFLFTFPAGPLLVFLISDLFKTFLFFFLGADIGAEKRFNVLYQFFSEKTSS